MRLFAYICFLSALSLSASPTASFVRVWPEYRTEESFQRLSEFFSSTKKQDRQLTLRTHEEERAGFYFTTRVKISEAEAGAVLVVEYILPENDQAKLHFFSLDLKKGSTGFLIGITGNDWPGAKVTPSAWQVRLLGSDGKELAREHSFLWDLPPSRRQPRLTVPDSVAVTTQ